MNEQYLLVGNPTARSGKAKARIEEALAGMRERDLPVRFLSTQPAGGTVPEVISAIQSGDVDIVVYLGGDGTFREVAKAVLSARDARTPSGQPVRMGMLPSGTANDQGKSFGISSQASAVPENLDILARGHVRPVDAVYLERLDADGAVVDGDWFFDSAGFGMHSAILVGRNRDREIVARVPVLRDLYRDQAVYVGAGLREYLRSYVAPTAFDATVIAHGNRHELTGLSDLIFNNTAIYAGSWVPARHCEPDDGLVECVQMRGRHEILAHLIADLKDAPVLQGAFEWWGLTAESFPGAAFDITLHTARGNDVYSQIDGEEWQAGRRFRVTVHHRVLPLIVPNDFVPPWSLGG